MDPSLQSLGRGWSQKQNVLQLVRGLHEASSFNVSRASKSSSQREESRSALTMVDIQGRQSPIMTSSP